MRLAIDAWNQGAAIPAKYAFGKIPVEGRFELGGNISPAMNWTDVPEDTRSFALLCHDLDQASYVGTYTMNRVLLQA